MTVEAFVYCWTDTLTNKLYIGSHKGSDVDGYVCSSKYMMAEFSIRPNDFVRTIIANGNHIDMLKLESVILQTVDAAKSEYFYNKHNNNGVYRSLGPKSDQCKEKMREKAVGRKRSVLSRVKQSKSVSGVRNHFFGKTHSDEVKNKLSEIKKSNYTGSGNPNSQAVVYNNVLYETKKEMTEKTGISLYHINKMIELKEVVLT